MIAPQHSTSHANGSRAPPNQPAPQYGSVHATGPWRPQKWRYEIMSSRGRDETETVCVTNLSENTREQDLQDLFRPFGDISRIFLAKDKNTGQSKGFAFITFRTREDAAKATSSCATSNSCSGGFSLAVVNTARIYCIQD